MGAVTGWRRGLHSGNNRSTTTEVEQVKLEMEETRSKRHKSCYGRGETLGLRAQKKNDEKVGVGEGQIWAQMGLDQGWRHLSLMKWLLPLQ